MFILHRCERLTTDLKSAKDQLLSAQNKDLDLKKCKTVMEERMKETNDAIARSNAEKQKIIEQLSKEVTSSTHN